MAVSETTLGCVPSTQT